MNAFVKMDGSKWRNQKNASNVKKTVVLAMMKQTV
jgi:hypothetical protein